MDTLLLGIYAFFVWLIFFKFKWLPWNNGIAGRSLSRFPSSALATLILPLNIFAPSTRTCASSSTS